MPATLSKADVLKAVEELPDENFALEDLIERLIVIHKVRTDWNKQDRASLMPRWSNSSKSLVINDSGSTLWLF